MAKKAQIITVLNSRGGNGQSTLSLNLAVALLQESKGKVALLDVALDNPVNQHVPSLVGFETPKSMEQMILQFPVIEPQIVKGFLPEHSSGIEVITGLDEPTAGNLTPENIGSVLQALKFNYDYIILNLKEYVEDDRFLAIMDNSQLMFVMVKPDFLSLVSAEKYMEKIQQKNYPPQMIKFILNESGLEGGLEDNEIKRFFSSKLKQDLFWKLPHDPSSVLASINHSEPAVTFAPRGAYSKEVRELGRYLNDENKKYFREKRAGIFNITGIPEHKWGDETPEDREAKKISDEEAEQKKIDELKKTVHRRLVRELDTEDIDLTSKSEEEKQRFKSMVSERIRKLMGEEASFITDRETRKVVFEEIYNEAVALGPLEELLADPEITEIMVNDEETVYVEKEGHLQLSDAEFLDRDQLMTIIDRIVAPLGRRIDESSPMVDGRLEDGSRVNAIIPPLALSGPTVTIRLFEEEKLTTKDLISFGSMTREMEQFLAAAVRLRKNIVVMGGTGSGKTTLLNIVSSFIPEDERIVTIEDSAELQLPQDHWVRLETKPPNPEGEGEVTIRQLIINSLRMRPDRIVVGECRGGEALDMLQAMNTGHDGSLTTVHANSPQDVISRLNTLVLMAGVELPRKAIMEQIFAAVDLIVQTSRYSDGTRKCCNICDVVDLDVDQISLTKLMAYEQTGIAEDGTVEGVFKAYGREPTFKDEIIAQGIELDFDIFKEKPQETGPEILTDAEKRQIGLIDDEEDQEPEKAEEKETKEEEPESIKVESDDFPETEEETEKISDESEEEKEVSKPEEEAEKEISSPEEEEDNKKVETTEVKEEAIEEPAEVEKETPQPGGLDWGSDDIKEESPEDEDKKQGDDKEKGSLEKSESETIQKVNEPSEPSKDEPIEKDSGEPRQEEKSATKAGEKICPSCGDSIPVKAKFCPSCGEKIEIQKESEDTSKKKEEKEKERDSKQPENPDDDDNVENISAEELI
ncbi:MAG: ATPase, T2SS/T4P/T4SS family [Elusimicrobiota bacterium]